jgi:hypothetical protein
MDEENGKYYLAWGNLQLSWFNLCDKLDAGGVEVT